MRWLSFSEAVGIFSLAVIGLIVNHVLVELDLRRRHDVAGGDGHRPMELHRPPAAARGHCFGESRLIRFRGPLADSYPAAVALVVFALIPYLALTAAINPLLPVLAKSLPLSPQSLQLATGMANAAYAFGTVLAVQFAVHLRGRRMLLLYATLFVVGSIPAALARTRGCSSPGTWSRASPPA